MIGKFFIVLGFLMFIYLIGIWGLDKLGIHEFEKFERCGVLECKMVTEITDEKLLNAVIFLTGIGSLIGGIFLLKNGE